MTHARGPNDTFAPRRESASARTRGSSASSGARIALRPGASAAAPWARFGPRRARLLDDPQRAVGADLGVAALLEPGGEDARDAPLPLVVPLDVEVADEELVVPGRPGPRPLPHEPGVGEDPLVPEVRPVEARLGPGDDLPRERPRDQREGAAGDGVLREPPPEPVREVARVDPVAVDEGVAPRADLEPVGVAVGGEGAGPARPPEEEVAVPLDVAQLHAPRREAVPGVEDAADEGRLQLRAPDEVVEDVAEEDDRPEAPARGLLQRGEEVFGVPFRLSEVGVREDGHPPFRDPPRLRVREHRWDSSDPRHYGPTAPMTPLTAQAPAR